MEMSMFFHKFSRMAWTTLKLLCNTSRHPYRLHSLTLRVFHPPSAALSRFISTDALRMIYELQHVDRESETDKDWERGGEGYKKRNIPQGKQTNRQTNRAMLRTLIQSGDCYIIYLCEKWSSAACRVHRSSNADTSKQEIKKRTMICR